VYYYHQLKDSQELLQFTHAQQKNLNQKTTNWRNIATLKNLKEAFEEKMSPKDQGDILYLVRSFTWTQSPQRKEVTSPIKFQDHQIHQKWARNDLKMISI